MLLQRHHIFTRTGKRVLLRSINSEVVDVSCCRRSISQSLIALVVDEVDCLHHILDNRRPGAIEQLIAGTNLIDRHLATQQLIEQGLKTNRSFCSIRMTGRE